MSRNPRRLARVLVDGAARVAISVGTDEWRLTADGGADITRMDPRELQAAWATGESVTPQRYLAPVRPGKVIGVGLNYRSHAREVGLELPTNPILFAKSPQSVIGHGDTISVEESVTVCADWEVELAIVIGQHMHRVSEREAAAGILGYTVANDVTARDIQDNDVQWFRAKSQDTFCPLGPWLVAADDLDPRNLRLRSRVNGQIMQDGTTADMHFAVPFLVSYCSHNFSLHPGDVLLTGTPPGVGAFRDPPIFLQHGDVVEVEIHGIGALANDVVTVPLGQHPPQCTQQ